MRELTDTGTAITKSRSQYRHLQNRMRAGKCAFAAVPLVGLLTLSVLGSNAGVVDVAAGPTSTSAEVATTTTTVDTTTTTTATTVPPTTEAPPPTEPEPTTTAPPVTVTVTVLVPTPSPTYQQPSPTYQQPQNPDVVVPPFDSGGGWSAGMQITHSGAEQVGASGTVRVTVVGMSGTTPSKTVNISIPGNLQVTSNPAGYSGGVWTMPGASAGQQVVLDIPVTATGGGAVAVSASSPGWTSTAANWWVSG